MPYTQGGTVLFQPETAGKMATGVIQSDGTYELTTYSSGDGAAVGKHRVFILPPAQMTDELAEGQAVKAAANAIPGKYASASTSGLVCDVRSGQLNQFPIELKGK
jgi:hypothetical protein